MRITRTKKALIAVIALVLVGIFVAVAALYLPGAGDSQLFKDNTVADSGSADNSVFAATASSDAPLEDGEVPDGYVPEGTGISDIAVARGDLDGTYHLTQNITINSLAVANNADDVNVFTGVFDGNGKTITIDATSSADISNGSKGGLFAILQGTVKNCVIVVENFQAKFSSGTSWANAGIIAGSGGGGNTLVQNVKIILKHSPDNMGNGTDNAYISQYVESASKGASMRLGGVFGNVIGNVTITDSTVDNQTSGNYGFSSKDWRSSGGWTSHSDGFSYIGGFFGRVQSGNISATRLTLAGTSSAKMHAFSESTSNYRYNQSFIGGILGYADEGKIDINGLIVSYPMTNNFGYTNGNYDCASGIINGWADDGYAGSVQNAYILSGVQSAYNQSNGAGLTVNYNTFTSDRTPAFNGEGVAFGGFTKQAPSNASAIVAEISQSGTVQNVMEALIAADSSEAGQSVWLTVPVVNATSTTAINLAVSTVSGSTIGVSSDLTFSSGEGVYMASREYNGENVTASIVLGDGRTDLYYSEANANKNVGTHTLTSNIASASGYSYIEYEGVKYVYNVSNKVIYVPQTVADEEYDVTKALSVEITKRAITLGKESGNITYGDDLATVQTNNIPSAMSGSFVSGEYVESCTIDGYVPFAVNAGSEATFSYASVTIRDAVGSDVTGNYEITYGTGNAVVAKKTIAGTLSVADLVYSNSEKVAVFTVTEGMGLFNGDEVVVSYSGDRENVTAEGFTATATVPTFDGENSNYTFAEGSSISQSFTITPCSVTIAAKPASEANTIEFNGGIVPNEVFADLYEIPVGLDGSQLFLSFVVTLGGEEATAQYAGVYTVTATLAAEYQNEEGETVSQANYVANSCETTLTVKAKEIIVSLSDAANSKTYDGEVVGDDYLQTMFVVEGALDEVQVAALEITVTEGTILNSGVYNINAALPSYYDKMYEMSSSSVTTATYTVEQVLIDGDIVAPEDSVYDGSEKFATFRFAEGSAMVGEDEVILTYATEGGQATSQVISAGTYIVSAALPAFNAEGKSNYKWASDEITTKNIVISKAPVTISVKEDITVSKIYDGIEFTDYASMFTAPKALDGATDLALAYAVSGAGANIVNAGVYTVTATLLDDDSNANYQAEAAVVTYTVDPKTVEIVWSENNYTYTGSVQTVTATYLDVNSEVVELAVSFGEGVEFKNVDEYTATASFANGETNYALPEDVTNEYYINKADSVIDTEGVATEYTYTGSLQTVTGATLNHSEAELVYENNTFTTVAEGNGLQVVISVADTANYNGTSTTVQITVNKATPSFSVTVEPTEGLFTSSEMPVITAGFGENPVVEGVIAWDTTELIAGVNEYAWTFTPKDTDNYNVVTGSKTLNVSAVELESIVIKDGPSKLNYEYGDKFDKTGMIVEAVYNDGTTEIIEDYTVADAYLTTLDENLIEISYNGKTATVPVNVVAKAFEIEYSDLTVVAGTEDFDLASIEASIVGTEGNTVTVAGQAYTYTVAIAYADTVYSAADQIGTTHALIVTLAIEGLDMQYYQSAYNATLKVIATPMTGSWSETSVNVVYDGKAHGVTFTADNGLTEGVDFEIQYALVGTDAWSTTAPVNAGEYVAKVVSKNDGYSSDRLSAATVTITRQEVSLTWTGESSVVFSGTAYEPTVQATGLIGEDKISVIYSANEGSALTDGKARNAGSYIATAVLPSDNYTFVNSETFAFSIEKVQISYSGLLDNNTKYIEYGGTYEPAVEDFFSTSVINSEIFEFYLKWSLEFDLTGIETAGVGTRYEAAVEGWVRYVDGEDVTEEFKDNFELVDQNSDIVVYVEIVAKIVNVTAQDGSTIYNGKKVSVEELSNMFSMDEDIAVSLKVNDTLYEYADIADVGEYNVSITSATENYVLAGTTSATFSINAADITVSVTGYSGTYDKSAHGAVVDKSATTVDGAETTWTYSMSEGGEYIAEVPEFVNAGTYTVYYKVNATNHNEASGNFTVSIEKADSVIDVNGVKTEYTYTGSLQTVNSGAELNHNEAELEYSNNTFTTVAEGNGMEVMISVDESTNYKAASVTVTIIVNKMTVEKPVAESGLVYDGTEKTGVVGGDHYTVINGVATDADDYTATVQLKDADNTSWTDGTTDDLTIDWSIAKADYDMSGVKFEDDEVIYNGEVQSIAVTGMPEGLTVSYSEGIKDVGSVVITAVFATENANYNVPGSMQATLTVNPKSVTVSGTVTAVDREYDGSEYVDLVWRNYALEGVIENDTVNFTYRGVMEDKNAGENKIVNVIVELTGEDCGNYKVVQPESITVNISPVEITVVWGGTEFDYNGTLQTPTASAETGILGETVTLTVNGGQINAGTYTATATPDNGNYVLVNDSVEFTINKIASVIDVSGVNTHYVYNGNQQIINSGATLNHSEAQLIYSNNSFTTVAKGNGMVVTIRVEESTNYYAAAEYVEIEVAKADYDMSEVLFEDATKVYNGMTQGITVSSLPTGADGVPVSVSYSAGIKDVGTVEITATFATVSGNYNVPEEMTATLTVTAKEISVAWSNTSLTYNGEAQAPTATAETGIAGETVDIAVNGAAVEPGTYTATATISDTNYKLMNATVEFSISHKEVVAEITAGYGELTVSAEGGNAGVQYKVGEGEWIALPADGKISVELAASWTVSLRYEDMQEETTITVYTTAENVVTYLESNLSDSAIENKSVIETAESWLATATGDKTDATAELNAAKEAYEAEQGALKESVENAFKVTAKLTTRTFAAAMAIVAVSGLGIAVGAIALVRKGGRKDENK